MDSNEDARFLSVIREEFGEKVPFNGLLGLKVDSLSYESVKVTVQMRDDLMGNYRRGILHGGVISSIIDATGGLSALMGVMQRMRDKSLDARYERLSKLSTIDLRVDFLRPGLGRWFAATASPLRTGNKVVVTRIQLNNDRDDLIAVGTGSYIVS
jgi:uncharacterized protein (TIGR00369 family)